MTKSKQHEDFGIPEIIQVQLFKSSLQPLHSAYLLFAEALFPMIARYLRRQQISFKVSAPLNIEKNRQQRTLFLFPKRLESKKELPRFVLSYLQELPRCQLFYRLSLATGTNQENVKEGAGFMVEYGFQHPLPLPDIADHLQTKNLYFLFGDQQSPTLIFEPAPTLINEGAVTKPISCIKLPQQSIDTATDSDQEPPLRLKLHLINDPQTLQPTQALYLKEKEISWLEILYQHLPGLLLARLRWAGDQKHGILLLPEDEELSLFPFGEPLKKIKNNLFLPLKLRLSPQLTNFQLEKTLILNPEKITFLTRKWRFDIVEKEFQPLDKMIFASIKTTAPLKFSEPDEPFNFIWQDYDEARASEEDNPTKSPKLQETKVGKDQEPSPLTITRRQENKTPNQISKNIISAAPIELLQEYALRLRCQNDFLGAATCFSLAEEPQAAAECYRLAALALEQQ